MSEHSQLIMKPEIPGAGGCFLGTLVGSRILPTQHRAFALKFALKTSEGWEPSKLQSASVKCDLVPIVVFNWFHSFSGGSRFVPLSSGVVTWPQRSNQPPHLALPSPFTPFDKKIVTRADVILIVIFIATWYLAAGG